MRSSFIPRLVPWHTLVLLSAVALLPGCALTNWRSTGVIETPDGKPFYLTSGDQKILIAPGNMSISPDFSGGPFGAQSLVIESNKSKLVIELHRGEATQDALRIVGATHGLSANIVGSFQTVTAGGPYEEQERESCTTSGHCKHDVSEEKCDNGKCKTETHTEYGYYNSCPGHRYVTVVYQRYVRSYNIAFQNPQNTTQTFGRYQGTSPPEATRIGSKNPQYCSPD